MTVLLSKGDLDVGGGNLSTGLWNAINKGLNIKLQHDTLSNEENKLIAKLIEKLLSINTGINTNQQNIAIADKQIIAFPPGEFTAPRKKSSCADTPP